MYQRKYQRIYAKDFDFFFLAYFSSNRWMNGQRRIYEWIESTKKYFERNNARIIHKRTVFVVGIAGINVILHLNWPEGLRQTLHHFHKILSREYYIMDRKMFCRKCRDTFGERETFVRILRLFFSRRVGTFLSTSPFKSSLYYIVVVVALVGLTWYPPEKSKFQNSWKGSKWNAI